MVVVVGLVVVLCSLELPGQGLLDKGLLEVLET
jgi:hypothetical protein